MAIQPKFIKDLSAIPVVFLVALPLCMGIAIASGAPPAAGLAVIVFEVIRDRGFTALGPILLLAGALQLIAGTLKAGRWFRAISPAVIHGIHKGSAICSAAPSARFP